MFQLTLGWAGDSRRRSFELKYFLELSMDGAKRDVQQHDEAVEFDNCGRTRFEMKGDVAELCLCAPSEEM